MRFFGGALLALGAVAIAVALLLALSLMVPAGAAIGSLGGAMLLLGAVLFGCGSIVDRLERANLLLVDIRNQGCADPDQHVSWKMTNDAQAARLGRWPATSWKDGPA